jgi:hypothetical protein
MKPIFKLILAVLAVAASVFLNYVSEAPTFIIPLTAIVATGALCFTIPGLTNAIVKSNIITSAIVCLGVGVLAATILGPQALWIGAILFLVSIRLTLAPNIGNSIRMHALATEIWTAELHIPFRTTHPWIDRVRDYSSDVKVLNDEASAIHMVTVGADPAVLINNTTYPIATSQRTDTDVVLQLDKFDTENTTVTDDELRGLSYAKIQSVTEQHGLALAEKQGEKANHAVGPQTDSAATPIVKTTGTARATAPTRKKLKSSDLIILRTAMDKQKVPLGERLLLLSPDHFADLCEESITLFNQLANIKNGTPIDLLGFTIMTSLTNPIYDGSFAKKPFGAAAAPTTDRVSSVAFHIPGLFRASGEKKMYYSASSENPTMRQTLVGFRQDFVLLPKLNRAIAAIVDDTV